MNTITVYETKWGGHIKTIDATTEPGGRTQAGMEHVNFVFGRVPESDHVTCIDIAKEVAYVLLRTGEGAKQVVGCSCPYFKKEHKVCEHLFALKDIDVDKLKESDGWLVTFLENDEHWHVVDGKLVPPSMDDGGIDPDDAGKPVPEPAKRPIIPPDPEIDIGVDVSDNTTTETTPTKDDEPKLWTRTCPYCPHVETGVFLDPVKAALAEHVAICPDNPANQPNAEVQKPEPQKEPGVKKTTPEFPETKTYSCKICGTGYPTSDEALKCIEKCKQAQENAEASEKLPALIDDMDWTAAQLDVMRKTVAKDASLEEFAYFLNVAKFSGLNPFLREIYFTKSKKTGEISIITGRDGYLTIARKNERFKGIESMEVCKNDEFEVESKIVEDGSISQTIRHKIVAFTDRGEIVGAWARGQIEGNEPAIIFATMKEYRKKGHMAWDQYPSAMIRKVAESMVLKRIAGISGLVTEAEVSESKDLMIIDAEVV